MIQFIQTIEELQTFIMQGAEEFEDLTIKRRFMLSSPGCNHERVEALRKKLPDLPESYTRFLERLNLNGVDIGWFGLTPSSNHPVDAVENVLEAQVDPFFPKEFMQKHRMYYIGYNDTDLVCVTAGTDKFKNGEILYVEEGDPFEPKDSQIHPLAENFEQFLLLAGNLTQIQGEMQADDSKRKEKRVEFTTIMKKLKVPEKYHKTWLRMI